MAQEVGVRITCSRQRPPAIIHSMTQEIQTSTPRHPVGSPSDSVSPPPTHLVYVFLHHCGVGQKLVVQPGLFHCLLHIVAEPQAMDDGLQGWGVRGMGSAWPRGRGRGRTGG